MFCNQCGHRNPEQARFCAGCGKRLEEPKPIADASKAGEATKDTDGPSLFGTLGDQRTLDGPAVRESQTVLESGSTFGDRYKIGKLIGRGGMGVVYEAFDTVLEEPVALKLLHTELANSQHAVERFMREAKISRQLSHDNIVRVHDIQLHGGQPCISMEFVAGSNLREWLHRRHPDNNCLTNTETVTLARSLCAAMHYAHRTTIHRDLKPENILIARNGKVKISDFGIASLVAASDSRLTQGNLGTAYYMAPEQLSGGQQKVDHRADVYSTGVILYEMLTGKMPVGRFQSPKQVRSDIPQSMDDAIMQALDPDPECRPETMLQLIKMLTDSRASTSRPALVSSGGSKTPEERVTAYQFGFLLGKNQFHIQANRDHQAPQEQLDLVRSLGQSLGVQRDQVDRLMTIRDYASFLKSAREVTDKLVAGGRHEEVGHTVHVGMDLGHLLTLADHGSKGFLPDPPQAYLPTMRQMLPNVLVWGNLAGMPQEVFEQLRSVDQHLARGDWANQLLSQTSARLETAELYRQPKGTLPPELQDWVRQARDGQRLATLSQAEPQVAQSSPAPNPSNQVSESTEKDANFALLSWTADTLSNQVSESTEKDGGDKPPQSLAEQMVEQGDRASQLGNEAEAFRCFDNATKLDPNLAAAWFKRGLYLRSVNPNATQEEWMEHVRKAGALDEGYQKVYESMLDSDRVIGEIISGSRGQAKPTPSLSSPQVAASRTKQGSAQWKLWSFQVGYLTEVFAWSKTNDPSFVPPSDYLVKVKNLGSNIGLSSKDIDGLISPHDFTNPNSANALLARVGQQLATRTNREAAHSFVTGTSLAHFLFGAARAQAVQETSSGEDPSEWQAAALELIRGVAEAAYKAGYPQELYVLLLAMQTLIARQDYAKIPQLVDEAVNYVQRPDFFEKPKAAIPEQLKRTTGRQAKRRGLFGKMFGK